MNAAPYIPAVSANDLLYTALKNISSDLCEIEQVYKINMVLSDGLKG